MADDAGEVTVIFCDICHFHDLVNECQDSVIEILDDVFRAFDSYCKKEGVQKIETVGKTYMACGGLKFLESTLTPEQQETNPTKRTVNVARKMLQFIKTYNYKPGKKLFIKIGIHRGNCILGLLGFHKPQFSLIGDTINTTSRHCTTGQTSSIVLSAEARNHLGGDQDVRLISRKVYMKGKGDVETFVLRENLAQHKVTGFGDLVQKSTQKSRKSIFNRGGDQKRLTFGATDKEFFLKKDEAGQAESNKSIKHKFMEAVNARNTRQQGSAMELEDPSNKHLFSVQKRIEDIDFATGKKLESEGTPTPVSVHTPENEIPGDEDEEEKSEKDNESGPNKDKSSKRKFVIGSIIKKRRAKRSRTTNHVLKKFEKSMRKKPKNGFLSKSKKFINYYLRSILKRNLVIIVVICWVLAFDSLSRLVSWAISDDLSIASRMNFPISRTMDILLVVYFGVLPYVVRSVGPEQPMVIKYCIVIGMFVRLIGRFIELFIASSAGDKQRAQKISLEIVLCAILDCSIMSCCVLLSFRQMIIANTVIFSTGGISLLFSWDLKFMFAMMINLVAVYAFNFLESLKFARLQEESFDNFLEIERQSYKMTQFVGRLLPKHIQNVVGTVGAKVGESYEEVTLLFADIVGFTKFSSMHSSRGVVEMLSRLFINFDIECQKLDLFKIYTIGDCYVVMGFTDKNNRKDPSEEAHNVVKLGIKMIEIIQKVRKNLKIDLNMRIGIHTGSVIAGIIGTDLVRFDIYGKDVLIANKMESGGEKGKICVSETTREYLDKLDTYRLGFEEHKVIEINSLNEKVKSYFVKLE